MNNLKERLLDYRGRLVRTLDAQEGKRDKYARGVATVTRTLLKDFDSLFDPGVLKFRPASLQPLIEKFCYKQGCPLCSSAMVVRHSRRNEEFLGCTTYPDYKGARYPNGTVSITDDLRFFLTDKLREETLQEEDLEGSRFRNLDL